MASGWRRERTKSPQGERAERQRRKGIRAHGGAAGVAGGCREAGS